MIALTKMYATSHCYQKDLNGIFHSGHKLSCLSNEIEKLWTDTMQLNENFTSSMLCRIIYVVVNVLIFTRTLQRNFLSR